MDNPSKSGRSSRHSNRSATQLPSDRLPGERKEPPIKSHPPLISLLEFEADRSRRLRNVGLNTRKNEVCADEPRPVTPQAKPEETPESPEASESSVHKVQNESMKNIIEDLQRELERLKAENKELHFKFVLLPEPLPRIPSTVLGGGALTPPRRNPDSTTSDLLDANRERLLREEIEDLRRALQAQHQLTSQLKQQVDYQNIIIRRSQYRYNNTAHRSRITPS